MLEAELVLELTAELGETQEVGATPKGFLRLIPITGGKFSGPNIKGKILLGGYDWNTVVNENITHVFAKYAIQTEDGVNISVENEGYLNTKEQNALIITSPKFQVQEGKYDWLNSGVFVGSLQGGASEKPSVNIKIYKLK
jgi:hypothetical protein